MFHFLDEQGSVIDSKIKQLNKARNLLDKRKLQIKEQIALSKMPLNIVFTRNVKEQLQLHVRTTTLTPYGNPDLYMRELALLLEREESSMVDNSYGCMYEFKDYKDTSDIIYSSVYTTLFGNEKLNHNVPPSISKKIISEGVYVCICFKWSKSDYFQHYRMLYDYICKNKIKTKGSVFEVSLPNKYLSHEEDDFITELRIKKVEKD
jgi:effector-binding domain-containing protein